MFGAVIGDIVGSRFEFEDHKSKDFDLFGNDGLKNTVCEYTDDSVMTIAVADALLSFDRIPDDDSFKNKLIERMHYHGRKRMNAGYGPRFYKWLKEGSTKPYYSFGNGSAMRVSPVGWVCDSLEDTLHIAKLTAEVTHNHPEGIKGAQAVAAAIMMSRNGKTKDEIRQYTETHFYNNTAGLFLDIIRPDYTYDVSCHGSVPVALVAFFEATDFEDAIKNAVSVGGDSDTLACITGGISEAFYGVPDQIRKKAESYIDEEMLSVSLAFQKRFIKP